MVLRVFHRSGRSFAPGFLDGDRSIIVGFDQFRDLLGDRGFLGWRAGTAGKAFVVLAQRGISTVGGGVGAQMFVESDFEFCFLQTGITSVA